MDQKEIFEKLFEYGRTQGSNMGVVASALVRDNEIIGIASSSGDTGRHAEDLLFEKLAKERKEILPTDTLFVTLTPCGKRTPGGIGEKYGDCTTKVLSTPIKKVVYASADSQLVYAEDRFKKAGVELVSAGDPELAKKAENLFVETLVDENYIQTRGSRDI